MCGVFAEFERSMISERIKSGLQRVRQSGKALGRPRREVNLEELKALYSTLKSVRATSKAMGISVGLAHQLLKERSAST
jgi:DNA invertase Pin-like site-specific DNA recombinase